MNKKQTESGKNKPLRVAAYIRVSSARQANEGDSLTAQKNEIEQEIEYRCRRDNGTVARKEFYVDAGKSAKNQNRPQLQRLKRDIEAGKIDVVMCFKLDRITRSLNDFVSLWQLFAQHNVDMISLREKFDTSIPADRAMLGTIMVFAQLEREMTAERTLAIMKDQVERGLWNGGHILGYKSDPADKGKLVIDEEGANIVRRVFDLFEELGSAGAVTRKLNDLGIRYPTFTPRSEKGRGGKLFTKQKIIGILRNRIIYLGEIHWGKRNRRTVTPRSSIMTSSTACSTVLGKRLNAGRISRRPGVVATCSPACFAASVVPLWSVPLPTAGTASIATTSAPSSPTRAASTRVSLLAFPPTPLNTLFLSDSGHSVRWVRPATRLSIVPWNVWIRNPKSSMMKKKSSVARSPA